MKKTLPKKASILIKVGIIISCALYVALTSEVSTVSSLEKQESDDIVQTVIPYESMEIEDENAPYMQKSIVKEGMNGLAVSYNGVDIEIQKASPEVISVGKKVESTFVGQLTTYSPDCIGCTGNVACKPGQNVKDGNIYFNDDTYGSLRIVAAGNKYPCGTVIQIPDVLGESVLGVVMDRGGSVTGNHIDLLFPTRQEALQVGKRHSVTYNVIRYGW